MPSSPKTPPDLRLAHGKRSCDNCKMYNPDHRTCKGYSDYPVEPDLVCDTWTEDPENPVEDDGYDD